MYLKKHQGAISPVGGIIVFFLLLAVTFCPAAFSETALSAADVKKLEAGEVLMDSTVEGSKLPFVQGKILIHSHPDKIWNIIANPLEATKTQKHIKKYRFLKDTPSNSVLDCQVEVASFLPRFNYVVESNYDPFRRIEFWRVGGALKDFRGYWLLEPRDNGTKTLLTYAMYLDPGFFVPQWIIRQGLRRELPETLDGIRARVIEIEVQANKAIAHRAG
jgi:hypothetical protein